MFSGIIQAIGKVSQVQFLGAEVRLTIQAGDLDLRDLKIGDSIATNGACLTITELPDRHFCVHLSAETLQRTSGFAIEQAVNLEKALRLSDRLNGHLVTGHIDGVGTVSDCRAAGASRMLHIRAPGHLMRYLAPKGSVTVHGVSLTINEVHDDTFLVNLIPYTLSHTNLQWLTTGSLVNLEVDTIARYLDTLCQWHQHHREPSA